MRERDSKLRLREVHESALFLTDPLLGLRDYGLEFGVAVESFQVRVFEAIHIDADELACWNDLFHH
jgi:hypothetical protein